MGDDFDCGWLVDEIQLDFFDLCEPSMSSISIGLESQTANEEENGENNAE